MFLKPMNETYKPDAFYDDWKLKTDFKPSEIGGERYEKIVNASKDKYNIVFGMDVPWSLFFNFCIYNR